ncbi:MAG: hypothetical protein BGO49_07570 [Planctomycetales bacterium 71-10]|nr:MAG: hypothetical protein BGO49_07570 [Planctomycetales bacterium 71-10]
MRHYTRALLATLCIASLGGQADAGPTLSIENAPSEYQAGGFFTVDLKLTGASNLNAYTVSLILEGSGGIPGVGGDYYFADLPDDLTDLPSVDRYVFGGDGFGRGVGRGEDGSATRLTLLDSLADLDAEVDVTAGGNDLIARIRIGTSSTMTGELRLSFDVSETLLLGSSGQDVPGFDQLAYMPTAGTTSVIRPAAIPEPASLASFLAGGATVVLGTSRARRRAAGAAPSA